MRKWEMARGSKMAMQKCMGGRVGKEWPYKDEILSVTVFTRSTFGLGSSNFENLASNSNHRVYCLHVGPTEVRYLFYKRIRRDKVIHNCHHRTTRTEQRHESRSMKGNHTPQLISLPYLPWLPWQLTQLISGHSQHIQLF